MRAALALPALAAAACVADCPPGSPLDGTWEVYAHDTRGAAQLTGATGAAATALLEPFFLDGVHTWSLAGLGAAALTVEGAPTDFSATRAPDGDCATVRVGGAGPWVAPDGTLHQLDWSADLVVSEATFAGPLRAASRWSHPDGATGTLRLPASALRATRLD